MKKAEPHHKKTIIDILTKSFETNQSVNFLVKQDANKVIRIRALMDYCVKMCLLFGEIFISDNENACALIIYPDKKKTTFKSILLDAKLILQCVGLKNIKKVLAREQLIKNVQPKNLMTYLWFIGVDPKEQNRGHGSRLLQSIITLSNARERGICLETSTIRNLPWYRKFGFSVYNEQHLSYHLYFLKRDFIK